MSSITRSFSLELSTSRLLDKIARAEKGRPFSHVLRDAVMEYAAKQHPHLVASDANSSASS
jgi:predicted DNA-binding ribbon-helix-helix protein